MKAIFTTSILTAFVILAAFIIYPPAINQAQQVIFKNLNEKKQTLKVVAELERMPINKKRAEDIREDSIRKAILDYRTELLERAQREHLANLNRIKKQNTELKAQNLELRRYVNRSFQAAKMDTPKDFGNGTEADYVVTSLKELKPIPTVIHDTIFIYKSFFESLFKRKKHE